MFVAPRSCLDTPKAFIHEVKRVHYSEKLLRLSKFHYRNGKAPVQTASPSVPTIKPTAFLLKW